MVILPGEEEATAFTTFESCISKVSLISSTLSLIIAIVMVFEVSPGAKVKGPADAA